MSHLINEIKLFDENYFFLNEIGSREDRIKFLSKINIFVGENNSGKSRLIRNILSNRVEYIPNSSILGNYNIFCKSIDEEFKKYFKRIDINIQHFKNIYNNITDLEPLIYFNDSLKLHEKVLNLNKTIESFEENTSTSTNGVQNSRIGKDLREIFEKNISIFDENLEKALTFPKFKKIYIPILRGLRPINQIDNKFQYDDIYQNRIKEDYFKDSKIPEEFEIFTGIESYAKIRSFLLGNLHQRKLMSEYEEYLSKNFYEGKDVTLIPSESSGVVTVKIGDEKERPIHELGDGIQSIIILTLPLFLNKGDNLLIFIEEPEKLLHPGFQRKLIGTFLKQEGFENYQYFITTHSNHFLDITLDFSEISIYTLKKELDDQDNLEKDPKFSIENLSQGDVSALELLGVRNSSVFLSNCTIWVEGITDRLYFRRYLQRYMDLKENGNEFTEFKEDFHYSFVEYGGGNITHWSFLDEEYGDETINVERLCGRLFLISDRDEGKESRHEKLGEILGERYYLLNCREVENLLAKDILLKVIKDYEKVETLEVEFEEDDYKNELLGKFIDEKLGDNRKRKRKYQADSGTIHDKINFCKKALEHIQQWDDLSEEAKEISKKMHEFISENNK
ncbi:ATP-binding protein [Methanosarcina sp. KYL-1]|uniref:AAA family ATPase n=1 Tax=Methanosarcina sp. KYL-1 TaxID=2602068 RepID=UPI00210145F7|nr:AAA family ATPase [Methanosarcina sp. KYL-1]MCQ1536678.1 ATP-binding protein [Methanosarcina sp. KYL-1]